MKWSYHTEASTAVTRLSALRSRFGRTQQLAAMALTLTFCIVALLAVSGRVNVSPSPTLQPTTQPVIGPATLSPAFTSAPITSTRSAAPLATTAPAGAKFNCGTGTAELRYVADRNGVIVFDGVDAGANALGTPLTYRSSVQVYGTVTGRMTGNSDKWYAVKYGERCAYIWEDPAGSRLSTTQPR
jgi:hypothetical protein